MEVLKVDVESIYNMESFDRLLDSVEQIENNNADVSSIEFSSSLLLVKPSEVDPCLYSFNSNHPIYPEETESSEEKDKLDEGGAKQQPTTDSGIFPADTTSGTFHRGNISESIVNSGPIFTTMLSPPSSSDGGDDMNDFESLFPELSDIENQIVRVAENVDRRETKNVIRVSVSNSPVMKNVMMTTNSNPSAANMHDYAVTPTDSTSKYVTKLGRPPKYVELEPVCGYTDCGPMSKNAVLARENRRRKKEYLSSLEGEISDLKTDKTQLTTELATANSTIDNLNEEIEYLKSVIANETTLGALLQNIPTAKSVSLKRGCQATTSSATKVKTEPEDKRHKADHDYLSLTTKAKSNSRPGVCLHVADGSVSLEFCGKCNHKSQQHQ